jgi:hypothetical protein
MIFKMTRVQVGGAKNLLAHITNEEDNDHVEILHGDESIPDNGDLMAQLHGHKYGNRHIAISPQIPLTDEQLTFTVNMLLAEYDPENRVDDNYLLIKHEKKRADRVSDAPHYHLVINETAVDGGMLQYRMMYLRNEKIARRCELEFRHPLTKGKHNTAVIKHLEENGFHQEAQALVGLQQESPASSAFSSKQLRRAERLGVDLPEIYYAIRDHKTPAELATLLVDIEKDQGVTVRLGDTRNILIIEKDGQLIADLRKLLKEKDIDHENINEQLYELRRRRSGSHPRSTSRSDRILESDTGRNSTGLMRGGAETTNGRDGKNGLRQNGRQACASDVRSDKRRTSKSDDRSTRAGRWTDQSNQASGPSGWRARRQVGAVAAYIGRAEMTATRANDGQAANEILDADDPNLMSKIAQQNRYLAQRG